MSLLEKGAAILRGNGRVDQGQGDLFDPHAVQLVRYDRARQALSEARDIDDVAEIVNKARAAQVYARLRDDGALMDLATEIRKRAEIKCGALLIEMDAAGERQKPGDNRTGLDGTSARPSTPTLADLNITKSESSRWQQAAKLPAEEQEAMIAAAKRSAVAKRKRTDASQEDAIDVCEDEVSRAVLRTLKRLEEPRRRRRLRERLHRLVDELIELEGARAPKPKPKAKAAKPKSKPKAKRRPMVPRPDASRDAIQATPLPTAGSTP